MHNKQRNTFQSDSPFYDLQYSENMHFLHQPLIIRLYTGYRLDQTLSTCNCIASLKMKVIKC